MTSGCAEPTPARWSWGRSVRGSQCIVPGEHMPGHLCTSRTPREPNSKEHTRLSGTRVMVGVGGCPSVVRGQPLSSPRAGRAQASPGFHHPAGIPHQSLVPGQWHRKVMPSPLQVVWFQGWAHCPTLPPEPVPGSCDWVTPMAPVSGPACRGSRRALWN